MVGFMVEASQFSITPLFPIVYLIESLPWVSVLLTQPHGHG